MMEFEFDPGKSATNRAKHGIDFLQAQDLWEDPDRVEVPARTVGESRWLVVARIGDVHRSTVVIDRDPRVRIVSVPRSRIEEMRIYEQAEH